MKRLSLQVKSGLYITGFTLFFILTLLAAIGLGFTQYFYDSKRDNMIEASRQIGRIYEQQGIGGEEALDSISQNLGADVLIVDNSQLVYSSRPSRRVRVNLPKTDEQDVVTVVGKEAEAQEHLKKMEMPKHIQEMLELLRGQKPDEAEIGKVQFYQPDKNFQYFNLISRIQDQTYLLISRPVAPMQETIAMVQRFIAVCGGVWLIVAVMAAMVMTRSMVRPLLDLKRLSAAMTRLDFSEKWRGTRTDEIGELGTSLNTLSEQLSTALTALQQSNAELQRQLDKAQEVEHMRKSFIFAVSHELKTPLALIQGYAEGLDSLSGDEAMRRRYCQIIQSETEKMDNLVKSLLNLSRLETGSFHLEKTAFDFGALADEAQERFARAVGMKRIAMTWSLPADMTAYGDPEQINSILGNFLSNAIDYTPDGGRIAVSAKDSGAVYTVSVYNQGIQIPEEFQQRIWEPFYKVDTARSRNTKRIFGGHGLGLGIVAALVKLHGQTYGMRNEADGVTFWFTVEKAAPPHADRSEASPLPYTSDT